MRSTDDMTDRSPTEPTAAAPVARGSNQSGMRAHNERLVLSLVRQYGALAKSDIARMTGLSAQTVSVIMRALEQDGLLMRGEPQRGRIGQPSVPMSLAPDGAFFLGLKIGRRSADLILADFTGQLRAMKRRTYRYPTPNAVLGFLAETLPEIRAGMPSGTQDRISGMGVAMPFELWSWVQYIGAPQSAMDAWRSRDIAAELTEVVGLPVTIQNDATAACGAELVFGTSEKPNDFLYFYCGFFIGGGLVINGQLFTGRNGNAAGVGPMPVPGRDGRMRRLLTVASLSTLAGALESAGQPSDFLWENPEEWVLPPAILETWIEDAAQGLAAAILSASALVEPGAVLIDGWMPQSIRAALTERTRAVFHSLDLAGIEPPVIREGTVGAGARALGAAAIPLSQRYLLETGPMLTEG
ncbi:ROK family transcriptional regulator [Gemmobacter denitrificans]